MSTFADDNDNSSSSSATDYAEQERKIWKICTFMILVSPKGGFFQRSMLAQMVHREHIPVSKTHHGYYICSETNENIKERKSCKNRVIFKRFDFYYVIG